MHTRQMEAEKWQGEGRQGRRLLTQLSSAPLIQSQLTHAAHSLRHSHVASLSARLHLSARLSKLEEGKVRAAVLSTD